MQARGEARLAWLLLAPAVGSVVAIALFPLAWAVRESFHLHDLRAPWLGQPWIGLANYAEAVGDGRLWLALAHTVGFAAVSVLLELALGLGRPPQVLDPQGVLFLRRQPLLREARRRPGQEKQEDPDRPEPLPACPHLRVAHARNRGRVARKPAANPTPCGV